MSQARAIKLLHALKWRIHAWPGLLDILGWHAAPEAAGGEPNFSMLFVCHGNVCRSPMAQDIMRRHLSRRGLLGRVAVASAGIECASAGRRPDLRARACVLRHAGNISDLRARRFSREDFDRFDLILVMDRQNESDVLAAARYGDDRERVRLLGSYSNGEDISDPVCGGRTEFERCFTRIERACALVLEEIDSPDEGDDRLARDRRKAIR
jgi:protein-tyrosine phosphatase